MLWVFPILFLILFYFYPLAGIFNVSFNRDPTGFFRPFLEIARSAYLRNVIFFTFWQAALSTLITLLIGLPGAYLFGRFDFPGKPFLQALFGIPFVLPTLVVAVGFSALLGPRGWVNLGLMELFGFQTPPIHFLNTLWAIIVAHVFYNLTIILRMVGDYWSHLNPRIAQASEVLGANRIKILFFITLPLLLPVIVTASLLVFIFDFTSFGVILVLGGPQFSTIEVEIYYQTIGLFNLPVAAALAIVQLCCTFTLSLVYSRLAARFTRPDQLKPKTYTQQRLTTWQTRLLAFLILSFIFLLLTTPLVSLVMRSFTRLEAERGQLTGISTGFTLDFYKEMFLNRQSSLFYASPLTAVAISLIIALSTVFVTLIIGIPAAVSISRNGNSVFNRFMDPILMLPLGTSAVTLGLGFIIALSKPPLELRSSLVLIPIAHTLVAMPFVIRTLTPSLRSVKPDLRFAASTLGASDQKVFLKIDLPLVGRALLVSAIFAFTISLGEFGATAMIARPEYPTVPVMIYRYLSQPGALNYGTALALSTLLMVISAASMLVIERFRIAGIGEF
jgi:thiamine transport system permease protein